MSKQHEYTVDFTKGARADLRDIASYIKHRLKEPVVAKNLSARIRKRIRSLDMNPCRHPLVRNDFYAGAGYRSVQEGNYTIFYIADEAVRQVRIMRIIYSRRDWTNMLTHPE